MNHTPVHVEDYRVPLGAGHYHVIGTSTNEIAYCARYDDATRLVTACNAYEKLVKQLQDLADMVSLTLSEIDAT
jgi:hypothetical protein